MSAATQDDSSSTEPSHTLGWRQTAAWPRVERGLDQIFKASAVRLLMLALIAFLVLPPKTYNSASLIAYLKTFFYMIIAGTSLLTLVGTFGAHQPSCAPRARRSTMFACIGAGILSVVDVLRVLERMDVFSGGLLPDYLSDVSFAVASHSVWAVTMLCVLRGMTHQAHVAQAPTLRAGSALGQRAILVMALFYGVHLAVLLGWNPATREPWLILGGLVMVGLVGTAWFVLRPISQLALWIRSAGDTLRKQGDVVALADIRILPEDEDEHGEPWIPHSARSPQAAVAHEAPAELGQWHRAELGFRRYLLGFGARAVVTFFGMLLVPGGESPYGIIVFSLIAVAQVGTTGFATSGLIAACAVPKVAGSRGLLGVAAGLALAMLVFELGYLALGLVAWADGPIGLSWPLMTTVLYALALLTMAFVTVSMSRLTHALRQRAAGRWIPSIAVLLMGLLGILLAMLYLGMHPERDVRAFGLWVGMGGTLVLLTVVVMYMHTVHATVDAINTRVVRIQHRMAGRT